MNLGHGKTVFELVEVIRSGQEATLALVVGQESVLDLVLAKDEIVGHPHQVFELYESQLRLGTVHQGIERECPTETGRAADEQHTGDEDQSHDYAVATEPSRRRPGFEFLGGALGCRLLVSL